MNKLFLSSSFANVVELFEKSIDESFEGKRVAFIPTASIHEEVTFYVDEGKKALEKLGLIIDILEISTSTKEKISNILGNCDYIYVSGGNTFFLLQELKKIGAHKIIIEQIKLGKIYIGESAGSVILSPDITYIKEMDDSSVVNLHSFSSLGVIDFYPLPHYNNFPFEQSTKKIESMYTDKIKLCLLNNNQAILVTKGKFEVLEK